MIGKRCGQCEFLAYGIPHLDCTIPQWIPLKNMKNLNERMPTDCPRRTKTREGVNKYIDKELNKLKK